MSKRILFIIDDVEYVLVNAEGEKWVITKEAHYNLQHQIKDLEIISEIDPNDLIGKMATNPFTGDEIPIFPASFVSASYGSGVVFSEPADAPADYIALQDLKKNDELIAKYNFLFQKLPSHTRASAWRMKASCSAFERLTKYTFQPQTLTCRFLYFSG